MFAREPFSTGGLPAASFASLQTMSRMINILVLCTANSARSILGEAVLGRLGKGRLRAFSAGSHPRGTPNPLALELLEKEGYRDRRVSLEVVERICRSEGSEDGYRDHCL